MLMINLNQKNWMKQFIGAFTWLTACVVRLIFITTIGDIKTPERESEKDLCLSGTNVLRR